MSALIKEKLYTPEEYLALEKEAEYRSEYIDGLIYQMAGGSLDHARIIGNIDRLFADKIEDNCESITSEIKIWIENYRKFYYPDVFIFCDDPNFYEDRDDILTNPVLIVEVLSDSTEAKDRGEKMLAYRALESLREYVLISQTKPIVEQFIKTSDGNWIHKATIGIKSDVTFKFIGVKLSLEKIYNRIEFEKE